MKGYKKHKNLIVAIDVAIVVASLGLGISIYLLFTQF